MIKVKATGVVRKVDELGRVVLPKELRETLDINNRDALEIFVSKDTILLKKYEPHCTFCQNITKVDYFKGKLVCDQCAKELSEKKPRS